MKAKIFSFFDGLKFKLWCLIAPEAVKRWSRRVGELNYKLDVRDEEYEQEAKDAAARYGELESSYTELMKRHTELMNKYSALLEGIGALTASAKELD